MTEPNPFDLIDDAFEATRHRDMTDEEAHRIHLAMLALQARQEALVQSSKENRYPFPGAAWSRYNYGRRMAAHGRDYDPKHCAGLSSEDEPLGLHEAYRRGYYDEQEQRRAA